MNDVSRQAKEFKNRMVEVPAGKIDTLLTENARLVRENFDLKRKLESMVHEQQRLRG